MAGRTTGGAAWRRPPRPSAASPVPPPADASPSRDGFGTRFSPEKEKHLFRQVVCTKTTTFYYII